MKKHITLLVLFIALISSLSYGQEKNGKTYKFINPEVVENINNYDLAFSTADMTKFRYTNKSNIIEFSRGFHVKLFSANRLINEGVDVNVSKVLTSDPVNKGHYIFDLSSDGKYIMQMFTKTKLK